MMKRSQIKTALNIVILLSLAGCKTTPQRQPIQGPEDLPIFAGSGQFGEQPVKTSGATAASQKFGPLSRIVIGYSAGWGYDSIDIDAEGILSVVKRKNEEDRYATRYIQIDYRVEPSAAKELLNSPAARDLLQLKKTYSIGVQDGFQEFVALESDSLHQFVYLDNYTPPEVARFCQVLKKWLEGREGLTTGRAKNTDGITVSKYYDRD